MLAGGPGSRCRARMLRITSDEWTPSDIACAQADSTGSGSATGASQREIARNVVNRLPEYCWRRTMVIENTDLERRVLAHERILQVLISHMAESEPKFLDRLKAIFTRHHTLGADEQDFTGTEQYAEQFIRQIEILGERKKHTDLE